MKVLISVPHGHPKNDEGAVEIARQMVAELDRRGVEAHAYYNEEDRHVLDANRSASRSGLFRTKLREAMLTRPPLIVDVHTFPDDPRIFWPTEVAILHTPGVQDRAFLEDYAGKVARLSARQGRAVEAAVYPARYADDIVIEARQLGHPSNALMLIEHKQGCDPLVMARAHAAAISSLLRERGTARMLEALRPPRASRTL